MLAGPLSRLLPNAVIAVAIATAAGGDAARPAGATKAPVRDVQAKLQRGRELFVQYGCGMCHILNDAGAYGDTGPSFDGDPGLTEPFIIDRVSKGQEAMPAYGKLMTRQEIAAVAAYIKSAAIK